MVVGEGIDEAGVRPGADGGEEDFDAPGPGDVVGILADEPGSPGFGEKTVEGGGDAGVRLMDDAQARLTQAAEPGETAIGTAVDDDQDFKLVRGLAQQALDGLREPWHGVVDRYAHGGLERPLFGMSRHAHECRWRTLYRLGEIVGC